ncbi:Hypothetical protein TPAS_1402 [Trichococcus pasteurii]|uniref:Uncharacterized protein n=2 Tax=root TaxID=1 RepID=A0A1W1IFD9_9LACT|nr:hypothetical protein SAMN04488086_104107 [Trichococcus pasteurii]SLM51724.1 Hypothetical protein TPAS_1402 [Trichococcus pasteurii]SSB92605.1 Hypothetical protein TPAS_1402 [Trichococcus pasteurii]
MLKFRSHCKVQPDSLLGRGSMLDDSAILLLDIAHYPFYSYLTKNRIAFFERNIADRGPLFSFLKGGAETSAVTVTRMLKLNPLLYPCGSQYMVK